MPSAYEGTDIISYLHGVEIYHTVCCISYRASDISLNSATVYKRIFLKEGAFYPKKLLDLFLNFAVAIVNLVDSVTAPKSSYMSDPLARAGASIATNINESRYAQSKKDFVAKSEIALKESNDTSYWLKLIFERKA